MSSASPRGELTAVADWFPRPPVTRAGRGTLLVRVEAARGIRVRLLTLHLKSKLVTYPSSNGKTRFNPKDEDERATGAGLALLRRTAEAAAVRVALNDSMQADPEVHTVVLGDMNHEPKAATSQLLVGPEERDVTSADKGDATRLHNLMAALPGPA
jgi:endonuclease/exonuclease/phosphatase family metal-dependent hydrolase